MSEDSVGAPVDRIPTLARTSAGYRVFDPALIAGTHYGIDDEGELVYTRLPAGSITVTVMLGSVVAAVWIGAESWLRTGVILLLALPTGVWLAALLLAGIHATTDPMRRYHRLNGHQRFSVAVTDPESATWKLCHRAEQAAARRSRLPGCVDVHRALGAGLWAAVGMGDTKAAESVSRMCDGEITPER